MVAGPTVIDAARGGRSPAPSDPTAREPTRTAQRAPVTAMVTAADVRTLTPPIVVSSTASSGSLPTSR